jgi:hypothetical protein
VSIFANPRAIADAREAGQVGAAVQAEVKRGEVAGFYVKRREDVTTLSHAERVERAIELLGIGESRASPPAFVRVFWREDHATNVPLYARAQGRL